jgi:hypothetical protein
MFLYLLNGGGDGGHLVKALSQLLQLLFWEQELAAGERPVLEYFGMDVEETGVRDLKRDGRKTSIMPLIGFITLSNYSYFLYKTLSYIRYTDPITLVVVLAL